MGCCQHDHSKPDCENHEGEAPKGGCCGGHGAKQEKCCGGNRIAAFFKTLFGGKCCGSDRCKSKSSP